jgi:hypothetical protein
MNPSQNLLSYVNISKQVIAKKDLIVMNIKNFINTI